jgi:predicted kinase
MTGTVVVVTGVMAAGKSTVAQLLAEQLPRSAHVRGDAFRRMIVSGRADLAPEPTREQVEQLWLRYRLAARTADGYAAAGFTAILQDVVLGPDLPAYLDLVRTRPRHLIVLAPRPDVVAAREAARPKRGYGAWTVAELDRSLRADTPRLGRWLDNSDRTPEQTVAEILAGLGPGGASMV